MNNNTSTKLSEIMQSYPTINMTWDVIDQANLFFFQP